MKTIARTQPTAGWNDPCYRWLSSRCNISRIIRISCGAFPSEFMTSADPVRRPRSSFPIKRRNAKGPSYAVASAVAIGALAALALVNRHLARKAERDNPSSGRFLDVNGVRLHYLERGSGQPLVLLHGNGSMIEDFESSGLIDLAARITGSSFSTGPASVTATGRATWSGRPTPRPN